MILHTDLGARSYDIVIRRGALSEAGNEFDLNRRVMVVTDSGVPAQYAETVAAQAKEAEIFTFPQGEASKNTETWQKLLLRLTEARFTRTDCVAAVGGGVVGDLAGFAAAAYLRGIDFYNLPTTVLAQVDSSVGGKVAVDLMGYKNLVGAFWQPKGVLIDPDVLSTLDPRQIAAGTAEAVKMALTCDKEFFCRLEQETPPAEEIIAAALKVKRDVVQQDETESGLRRVLNFGHTVGHAIETVSGYRYLHGECVALGMLPMCSPQVRERLLPVLERLGLPTRCEMDPEAVIEAMRHDKKCGGNDITAVYCEEVGSFVFRTLPFEAFAEQIRKEIAR